MIAQIDRDFEIQAAVHLQDKFLISTYFFTLGMEVNTESIREQNVAMERIKYFLFDRLEHSVFVQDTETEVIERYQAAGIKVCTVPNEPYDQIISLLLLMKIDAIVEGRLTITDITLSSSLSDGIRFRESFEEASCTLGTAGWWTDPLPSIMNRNKTKNKKDKVVKLVNKNEWNDINLTWVDKTDNLPEILFTVDLEK